MKKDKKPVVSPALQLKARLEIIRNPAFSEKAKDHFQKLIEADFATRLTPKPAKGAK